MYLARTCALLIGLQTAALFAAEPPQPIIVVRHAERAGAMTNSAGISELGKCRAGVLAGMLADANIAHIFVSEVERTQQTAEPLAKKLNVRPEVMPAEDVESLVKRLRAGPHRGAVLVVGHSNTVPAIVGKLSGKTVPPISDTEFDRMYVLTLTGPATASVASLRYPGCDH
jgi:broad specificity phosphatase PhoE